MALVEFRVSEGPPAGAFSATAFLTDHSAGDTTTNASGFNPNVQGDIQKTFGAAVDLYVEGRYTLDSLSTLTAAQFTGLWSRDAASNTSNSYALYGGDASENYTLLASGTAAFNTFVTTTWSGSVANVKYIKARAVLSRLSIGAPQISLSLTDFRITSSDPAIDIPLTASVVISITGGSLPSLNARTAQTFTYFANALLWLRDCVGPVLDWTETCTGNTLAWAKDCSETTSTFVKAAHSHVVRVSASASSFTKACAGTIQSWTKRSD